MPNTFLRSILETTWIRVSDYAVIPHDTNVYENDFVVLGERAYPIRELRAFNGSDQIEENCRGDILPNSIAAQHDHWQIDYLLALRPIVFFTVFGPTEMFEMLRLALESFKKNSQLDAHYVLVTRAEDSGSFESVFSRTDTKFDRVITIEAHDTSDFTFARYTALLSQDIEWRNYSPIIYVDSDVVCDGPLLNLCIRASGCIKTLLFPEHHVLAETGWYGDKMLLRDSTIQTSHGEQGFNSGVILASRYELLSDLSSTMLSLKKNLEQHAEEFLAFYDQPLLNYIGRKFRSIDTSILPNFLRLVGHANPVDPKQNIGLVHFQGGVGNFRPKLFRMNEYIKSLD